MMELLADLRPNKLQAIIFAGDFKQCPPVIPAGGKMDILQASPISLGWWKDVEQFHLFHNFRAQKDAKFAEFVLKVNFSLISN